jgi:hypothetical protein
MAKVASPLMEVRVEHVMFSDGLLICFVTQCLFQAHKLPLRNIDELVIGLLVIAVFEALLAKRLCEYY